MSTVDLPLFPLHTVLFPGGQLRLRIFEPRYLDLVRRCTREETCFGVCLMLEASPSGDALPVVGGAPSGGATVRQTLPAAWGTRARITDFFATDEGMLGITATGEGRFHVLRTRVRDSGLIVADVELHDEPPAEPLRPEHCLLSALLERLHERVGGPHASAGRARYDDAAWVGYRLAELLPLSATERQALLQAEDAHARLSRVSDVIARLQGE